MQTNHLFPIGEIIAVYSKNRAKHINILCEQKADRLCGLVVRVPGYRFRGPGSIPGTTSFFWEVVGLERGPISLVMVFEELFQGNSGSGLKNPKLTTVGEFLRWPRDTFIR
jgi:hypothetical protein